MRKIFSLMTVLSLLFVLSCEKENGHKTSSSITFTFSNIAVTASTVNLTITPSDLTTNYFVQVAESSEFAGKDGATVISEMLGASGTKMYSGVQDISKQNLKADTSYTIAAFAYGETANVSFFHVKTKAANSSASDFSVTINVNNITAKSATINVVPSDDTVNYFARVITQMEIALTDGTDLDIVKYCVENPYHAEYLRQGPIEYDYVASPKMDYVVVAFNYDNITDVVNGLAPVELFKYEFSTPDMAQVDPDTMFLCDNMVVDYTGFSIDVTPVHGEDAFWSYYVYTKKSYEEELNRNYNQVVMHAYFGLQGLLNLYNYSNDPDIDFSTFMTEFMGITGSASISNYEDLRPGSDYVLVLFYMDPDVVDPTAVYDYTYVPIEFRTLITDEKPYLAVDGPYIEDDNIMFNIKTGEEATKLIYGAAQWSDLIAQYYDTENPYNGDAIRAFIDRRTASEESLTAAKSAEGVTFSFEAPGGYDGIFFFEVENAVGNRSQYVVRITPDMF